uniref:Ig-like domain-containing protein n=1 Tax=Pundamilia nyererei TaxID=303518 RepID=A0A3B4H2L0_9CICH
AHRYKTFTSLRGRFSSVSSFKVMEGGVASLSCQYSVQRFGLSRVCWGRGCGTFWCSNILVQTDENGAVTQVEDRYQLTGDIMDGQMDLDILNVRRTDSGPYCCRVDINGLFNDQKMIMNLRVVKGERLVLFLSLGPLLASSKRNCPCCSLMNPLHLQVEDTLPSLSLQINVPVLSLSVSVLMVLAAVFLFLAFRRTSSMSLHFSSEEPPHIIYEIRMRRPVQENIYTLD